jgi:hypothetical protein
MKGVDLRGLAKAWDGGLVYVAEGVVKLAAVTHPTAAGPWLAVDLTSDEGPHIIGADYATADEAQHAVEDWFR